MSPPGQEGPHLFNQKIRMVILFYHFIFLNILPEEHDLQAPPTSC